MLTPIEADVNTSNPSIMKRLLEFSRSWSTMACDLSSLVDRVDQQHELVAADAREHVRFAQAVGDPRRDLTSSASPTA